MIRRFTRRRSIIARPQRTSMARICRLGELLITYKGVEKIPSAIRRSQSRIDLATFCISNEVLVSYQECGENTICHFDHKA